MRPLPAFSLTVALSTAAAIGLAQTFEPEQLPLDALKSAYMSCDRVSAQRPLSPDESQWCGRVGEVLQVRHFDGSFEKLIAWWREEKARVATTASAAETRTARR